MKLELVYSAIIYPKAPYNFKFSVENPSHYPVPTSARSGDAVWFTTRFLSQVLGVKLENLGGVDKPKLRLAVYAEEALKNRKALLAELGYRCEFGFDYSEFYNAAEEDKILKPVADKYKGMRMFCFESLYEYLMIAILLQNMAIKRSEAMTKMMLDKYGDLAEFDGQRLYCFWSPERILQVKEEELRALKVGYRAKSFLRASKDVSELKELDLREMSDAELRKTLLSIYGVGPASLDYLSRDVFHRKNALNAVPPWEAKIYSKLLGINTLSEKRILKEVEKYGEWRAAAMHYLFMDLNWRHRAKPVDWYAKLMPF